MPTYGEKYQNPFYGEECLLTHSNEGDSTHIISRWAPPEENDMAAYIRFVLGTSRLGGKENLLPPSNVAGYGKLSRLIAAMTCMECGIPYAQVDTEAICKGYRLAFPENNEELNKWLDDWDEYAAW